MRGHAALLAACAAAATGGACAGRTTYALEPAARAGGGAAAITAVIDKVAVTPDLAQPGASLSSGSQIAVQLILTTADPRRAATVGRLALLVQDALGGPELWAGPAEDDRTGLGLPAPPRGTPRPSASRPIVIAPGQTITVSVVFAGFPPEGPSTPVRAVVFVPVDGSPPLRVPIAELQP